jgi:hypothetical protein
VDVGKNSSVTRVNERLVAFENWTAQSIDKRQEMLVNLAKEIWRVNSYEN